MDSEGYGCGGRRNRVHDTRSWTTCDSGRGKTGCASSRVRMSDGLGLLVQDQSGLELTHLCPLPWPLRPPFQRSRCAASNGGLARDGAISDMHRMLGHHRGVPGNHRRERVGDRSHSNVLTPSRYACWAALFWLAPLLAPSGSHTNPACKLAHGSLSRYWTVGFAMSYRNTIRSWLYVGPHRCHFVSVCH
ncbi:hypothetical protein M440DRAFT_81644 [Trichoderma longibrachiatum ATCC 18648]|uniref:Uncharacterized protein n=1 Tax=Trichoderma longibrachiatum ATCC 18648 TaxID=983965 RepID=A0A2T4CIG2_TRILO|nr:hypothetical protein M440DRAFT_81644 [Trichoderma longibrachiatum ATCC 18648]